jgi:D-alanyl-lipoteichoic acid acyltransferase DltB (MBOAT superfamily)
VAIFSFTFLTFAAVTVLAWSASRSGPYRRAVLTVANLVFVATFFSNWWSVAAMAGVVLGAYLSLLWIRRQPRTAVAGIIAAVTVLLVVRRYAVIDLFAPGWLDHPVRLVGISYMTFKYIHAAVDQYQGQLDDLDLITYVNYQLGFWCLVAGPIQRFNDFARSWREIGAAPSSERDALLGWRRALVGMLKIGVIATMAWQADEVAYDAAMGASTAGAAAGWFLVLFYAFPVYVYFNFAGYCDVVIGLARVLGLKHQENFDRPYLARNVLDFWNRWHISLTLWIRDYLFTPLYKAVAARWPDRATMLGYGVVLLALCVAGVWHGSTWNFVAFGLIHGVGAAGTQIYGDALKARMGRTRARRYFERPAVRRIAIVGTLHYVCLSFLFFRPDLTDTVAMLRNVGSRVLQGS